MNKKIVGTHVDSNVTRNKQKKEAAQEYKSLLPESNLRKFPKNFFVSNKKIYNILVDSLEKMGFTHLVDLDIFSIISVANTIDLLNQVEQSISDNGITQELLTREGSIKTIPSPMIQQRNTLINTLKNQLTSLQLDPLNRHNLMTIVNNDISSLVLNDVDLSDIEKLLGEL